MKKGMFDLRDVMLEATAELQEVLLEMKREIAEPQMAMQFMKLWAELPEEMREQFAKDRPEEYHRLMDLMED